MSQELALNIESLLPSGRMITSDEGDGDVQPLWLSDQSATAGLWETLHAEHARSGMWPLLLDALSPRDEEFRPWASGELFPERMSSPATHDPAGLLAEWWATYTAVDEDGDMLSADKRLAVTAPFGQRWPGTAPSPQSVANADAAAAVYAQTFLAAHPRSRLGLVVAATGAEALTVRHRSEIPKRTGWHECTVDDAAEATAHLAGALWHEERREEAVCAEFLKYLRAATTESPAPIGSR